jgi:hypothetical protein
MFALLVAVFRSARKEQKAFRKTNAQVSKFLDKLAMILPGVFWV